MTNGHLPNHTAWIAYKHQLWPGVRYGLGTMTNDLEVVDSLLHNEEYRISYVLGVVHSITKGLHHLHKTFGGFGLINLPVEQLIRRVNMLMQHYHTSTNLSRKLDASLRYLQLQLGMPHNPILLHYAAWGHLAQLPWVKMLWRMLHHFDIHLHMAYPNIAFPQERDQVIMEIFFSADLSPDLIQSLGRCWVVLEAIFLSDLTTVDGKYLKDFVFAPGGRDTASTFKFSCEQPTRSDWNSWFKFWHNFTTTGDTLKVPLGNWISPTHCIRKWYYRADTDNLQWIEGNTFFYYSPSSGIRFTRATRKYHLMREEPLSPLVIQGIATSVTSLSDQQVVKLSKGLALAKVPDKAMDFWEFFYSWGGNWMWEGIETGKDLPYNMSWVAEGMTNNSLVWVMDSSYDKKKAIDLCRVGWILFCTKTGFCLTDTFWEKSNSASSYRAELLGLCALHLLARAVVEYYKVEGWSAMLCCNNKCALELSSHHLRRIRPSA